jgi:hypothetical protein
VRAVCIAQAAPARTVPWSLPVLLPVPWLLRHAGPLSFAAGCTDNPATHRLKKQAASPIRGRKIMTGG